MWLHTVGMGKVRLRDVAELAGVSERTVANVVSNHKNIRDATRQRVQEAIDALGYTPNMSARRLATGATRTIAFGISAIDAPYFSELAAIVIDEAKKLGYSVLVEHTENNPKLEARAIERRESGLVDGVLLFPAALSSADVARIRHTVPLVLLGETASPVTYDHVVIDNIAAAVAATEELIHAGATKLAFLGAGVDDRTRWVVRGRLGGWQQALEAAGLDVSASRVFSTPDWSFHDGYHAIDEALTSGVEFDGLLCAEDKLAFGALASLHAHGVRVPDDVVVSGWDNIAAAAYSIPSLTSVAPDKQEMIATALRLLINRIEGDDSPVQHVTTSFTIAARDSTKRAGQP